MMKYLKLSGDEPVPSTDEESIFVGENDARAIPDGATGDNPPPPVMTMPAPGAGGAFPLPAEDVDGDQAADESIEGRGPS